MLDTYHNYVRYTSFIIYVIVLGDLSFDYLFLWKTLSILSIHQSMQDIKQRENKFVFVVTAVRADQISTIPLHFPTANMQIPSACPQLKCTYLPR